MVVTARDWRKLARQGSRYLLTGGSAAVIDITVFTALLALGLPLVPAAACSFVCGTIVNYLLTSRFVFEQARSLRGYLSFGAVACIGLALNVTLTAAFAAHTPLTPVLAKAAAIAVSFVFNFTLNALLVFRPGR